ncbi:SlyX family protein [Candidatus Pelagibacter bacterium]|nr:SlyX family protein [Candidatus Pelagibacter bacterium]
MVNSLIIKENLDKKLEEQITFLQQEISQLSSELYSQQKEIKDLKKQIINLINRIEEVDSENVQSLISKDKKPPHY